MENENDILEYNGDISEHTTDDEQIEKPKKKKRQLEAMEKARQQHLKMLKRDKQNML